MAPAAGEVRADFTPPPTSDFEVAVFVSTDRATLFTSAPNVPAPGATSVTVGGLADGFLHHVGLGIRPVGGGSYAQSGPVLTVTPGAPFYVDAAAPAGGDGLTPASAFQDMLTAVFNAFVAVNTDPSKSVNVWVKGGTYPITNTLPITAGVNVYGGFGAAFDLASRDLENSPTIWSVAAGQQGFQYGDDVNTGLAAIVDGVRIVGNGLNTIGVDTNGTDPSDLELRSVIVTDMDDRGIRLRNLQDSEVKTVLTNCQSSRNGGDGLSGSGAFDYSVYNCAFALNVQEGMDLNDLTTASGGTATCRITSSQFFGNGAEGLDCTLGTPFFPSSGSFEVDVRACAFERNAAAGCLIDADFETVNGYSADVVLRESLARGNGGPGFHLDLDAPLDLAERLTAFVYRVLATSNALDGLYVTSETRAGLLGVSTSAFVGNASAGLRIEGPPAALGNRAVAVTHCLFAGNAAAGMTSRDVPASAVSSIAYLQSSAFDANTLQVDDVSSNDPAALAFLNAPEEYALVTARSGAVLTLAAAPGFTTAAKLELADDGAERSATSIAGAQVTLSEAPDDLGLPGLLAAFAPGAAGVDEDYGLAAGSIALGSGLNGADAGPSGSATPGPPGMADEQPLELFYSVATTPEIAVPVGANESLVIEFSQILSGASVNASTVRALRGATPLGITLLSSGAQLTIDPPGGDWGAGDFRVELDGVQAADGTVLSGALVLPFQR